MKNKRYVLFAPKTMNLREKILFFFLTLCLKEIDLVACSDLPIDFATKINEAGLNDPAFMGVDYAAIVSDKFYKLYISNLTVRENLQRLLPDFKIDTLASKLTDKRDQKAHVLGLGYRLSVMLRWKFRHA